MIKWKTRFEKDISRTKLAVNLLELGTSHDEISAVVAGEGALEVLVGLNGTTLKIKWRNSVRS